MSAAAVAAALLSACTPLPVPHPEYWAPSYGATDYPGASRVAGYAGAGGNTAKTSPPDRDGEPR